MVMLRARPSGPKFVFNRGEHAESRVQPSAVVEHFPVLEQSVGQLDPVCHRNVELLMTTVQSAKHSAPLMTSS